MIIAPHESAPFWNDNLNAFLMLSGLLFLLVLFTMPGKILTVAYKNIQALGRYDLQPSLMIRQRVELIGRMCVINLLQGFAASLLLWSIYPGLWDENIMPLWILAAYPVSRFIGQAMLVVPGGLGIREGLYALILSPYIPIQPLLITAGVMRLLSILLETLLLISAFGLSKLGEQRANTISMS
jgi:uncharacterized membrane protein YbhN (UPF0104 family)